MRQSRDVRGRGGAWRRGLDADAERLVKAYEHEVGDLPAGARQALAETAGTIDAQRARRVLSTTCEPADVQKALASLEAGGTPALSHGGNGGFVDRLADLRKGTVSIEPTPDQPNRARQLQGPKHVDRSSMLVEQTKTWDATETAARIASGEVSAVEVTAAAIARAKASQPKLHAIVHPMYEAGLQRAERPGTGCFAGVPTFVKDMEELEGTPTGLGTSAMPAHIAQHTAASVAQFLTSGAITIGKTTTAEFGLTPTTEPVGGVPTKNPFDLERTAGGSSGGAAALVAAGVVPVAHGGDGGGSVRIPASFCGLVGLKATRGRLAPMTSARRMPVKIATYGMLSRSVRDTAAFFESIDRAPIPGMAPIGKVQGPGKEKLRVGLFIDPPNGTAVDPEVRAAVMATARELELQGHRVDFIPAPYDQGLVDDFMLYWGLMAMGVASIVKRTPGGDVNKLEPWTRDIAAEAKKQLWRVPTAVWRLRQFHKKYAHVFDRCDVMLSPTAAAPAPKLGYVSGDQPFEALRARLLQLVPYTPVQNASGGPAISVPVGKTASGLPIGAQIAAPWGQERRLIELAFALE